MNTLSPRPDNNFPKTVAIDTCSFCNFKCSMCPHSSMKREKGRMNWDIYKKIIDEIAIENPETRVWLVFFGEALILKKTNPNIFNMIAYAKEKGLKNICLNSNGALLDSDCVSKLIKAGLDEIYIGIDAITDKTYKNIRVGGDFETTKRNVVNLISKVKEEKSKKPMVQIQFIEMEENRSEKSDFVKFWLSKGANVKVRQKVSWGGLIDRGDSEIFSQRHSCYWSMNVMAIIHNGRVVTCAADPEGRFIAGNVAENSLKEIWNGQLKKLRDCQTDQRWSDLPLPCSDCTDWAASHEDKMYYPKKQDFMTTFLRNIFTKNV